MKRSGLVLLSVLLLFATYPAWGQLAKAQAEGRDCSSLVVNRSFSQTFEGFTNLGLLSPGAPLVPNAGAGFVTFLPDGKWTAKLTIATGMLGLFRDVAFADGLYEISIDTSKNPPVCTGTMTGSALFGPPLGTLPVNFQLLVADEGKRIETIHTDAPLIVGISGFPVRTFGCSNQTIGAEYSSNVKGWGLAQPSGPLSFPPEQLLGGYFPFAFSGAMEFQPRVPPSSKDFPDAPAGSASVVAWDSGNLNGTIFHRTEEGWYKVNPDCSGTLVLRDNLGFPDFHLEMFVGKNGKALHLVNTDTATLPGLPVPVPAFILGTTLDRIDGNGGDQ